MNCKEAADWVDAYLDQEIELAQQLAIEQHLSGCAPCQDRLDARRQLQDALRSAPLRYAPPTGFDARLRRQLAGDSAPRWTGWWAGFLTAAAATSFLFVGAPYALHFSQENRLTQEVTDSHVRALLSHHVVDIENSNQHVVKPWFNGRIDFAPDVRDFSAQGFPLGGGRVDYLAHRPVAALVYHRALHPITLYTWPARAGDRQRLSALTRQGYHLLRWSRSGMTYWLISDLNEPELRDLADLLRR